MMIRVILLFLILFSSSVLSETNWYQVSANSLLVADWLQTREIIRDDNYFHETNGMLGKYPSKEEVDLYFAASILLTNVIGELLPNEYGNYFYLTVSVVEANVVLKNYALGVRIKF